MAVRNRGTALSRIDSLRLTFTNGAINYTVSAPSPALPRQIAAGATTNFTFVVNVLTGAQLGIDSLNARLVHSS